MSANTPLSAPADTVAEPAAGVTTDAVDAFLMAVRAGAGIPADVYEPNASLDATVPNWRFVKHGAAEIADEYGRWFTAPGEMEELERIALPGGELAVYLLTWSENGVPHAAHHCHVLRLGPTGRIASDTVFCGGRWPASLLAEIADAMEGGAR